MALLIAATAVKSWRRIGEMRDRLVRIQSESFRIADQFQRFLRLLVHDQDFPSDSAFSDGIGFNI